MKEEGGAVLYMACCNDGRTILGKLGVEGELEVLLLEVFSAVWM